MNNIFKFSFGIFTTLAVAWLAFVVGARKQFGDLSPTSSVLNEDGNIPEDSDLYPVAPVRYPPTFQICRWSRASGPTCRQGTL